MKFAFLICFTSFFYLINNGNHSHIITRQKILVDTGIVKNAKITPTKTDLFLEDILKKYPQYFNNIISKRDELKVQVIYTQINRDINNKPSFKDYYFNVNPDKYFYPASTVKMQLLC
jgi:hypothetical protein